MTEAKPLTKDEIAEAIKMATWFTTGADTHLRSPAWNIARALLHSIATIDARDAEIKRLRGKLSKCAQKLERCIVVSGTDPEYAAIAISEYVEALASTESPQ